MNFCRGSVNFGTILKMGVPILLISTIKCAGIATDSGTAMLIEGLVRDSVTHASIEGAEIEYRSRYEMIPTAGEEIAIVSETDASGSFSASFGHSWGETYKGRGDNLVRVSPPSSELLYFFLVVYHPDYEGRQVKVEFEQYLGDEEPTEIDFGEIDLKRRVEVSE